MKFTLLLAVTIVLLVEGCKGENSTAIDLFPNSTSDNPIFDITPILNIVKVVQSTFLGALQNIGNLIHNSADSIINQLRGLRAVFFDSVASQVDLAIQRLKTALNSTRSLIEESLQAAENTTLAIASDAQRVADCLSKNLTDTTSTIQAVAIIGYNCVAAKLNQGIDLFNILVKNLTKQGTTIFSLPDQIDICNKYQSGFFDFVGFIRKSNCLNSLPGKITADGLQFFATVTKSVSDASGLVASLPQAAADCAQNATNRIQQTRQLLVSEVANCTKT